VGDGLRLIGYWRSRPDDGWPDPADWVDESWDAWDHSQITDYLARGIMYEQYRGLSPCRLCGEHNGSAEYTDWTYVWPEGLAHYVGDHWVRLPDVVLEHIRYNLAKLKQLEVDADWWKRVDRPSSSR
jgi:hypothetical protein